jgi:hypothetical protein
VEGPPPPPPATTRYSTVKPPGAFLITKEPELVKV